MPKKKKIPKTTIVPIELSTDDQREMTQFAAELGMSLDEFLKEIAEPMLPELLAMVRDMEPERLNALTESILGPDSPKKADATRPSVAKSGKLSHPGATKKSTRKKTKSGK
jgi:hypothetical protein